MTAAVLLLLFAAAPDVNPSECVVVRISLTESVPSRKEVVESVEAALVANKPSYRGIALTPEGQALVQEAERQIHDECWKRFPDMTSSLCQAHLHQVLSARLLSKYCDLVLDLGASQVVEKPNVLLEAALWNPKTGKGKRLKSQTVLADDFAVYAMEATQTLLENGGTPFEKVVKTPDELAKTWKSVFKKEQARKGLPIIEHDNGCQALLPPKLTVKPDDGLARTLADRWQSSVRNEAVGKSPEECTLSYTPLIADAKMVHVQLKCGALESTSLFREEAPLDTTLDQVSEDLISFQLEQRCTGQRGDTPTGDKQVREYLESLRSDDRNRVEDAMMVLSTWGPRAVPLLVAELNSNDTRMRTRVAQVLGALGPQAREAIPALERATTDADAELSRAAQQALQRIKR